MARDNKWISFRAKTEEIMELVLIFGGGTLTALITLGILPFGVLGIGICGTLTFIGASRLILTNSFLGAHGKYDGGQGFVTNAFVKELTGILKFYIIHVLFSIVGVGIVVLGLTGALGVSLSLGLGFGVPIFALGLIGIINYVAIKLDKTNHNKEGCVWDFRHSDNLFGVFMMISGITAGVTFGTLGLTNTLPWMTALALGTPLVSFALVIGIIFAVTGIGYKLKNKKKEIISNDINNSDDEKSCRFLSLGFGPTERDKVRMENVKSENEKCKK